MRAGLARLWVAYDAGMAFERITVNPERMGGKPCIRDLRVTVTMVLGQLAGGRSINSVFPSESSRATRPTLQDPTSITAATHLPVTCRPFPHAGVGASGSRPIPSAAGDTAMLLERP